MNAFELLDVKTSRMEYFPQGEFITIPATVEIENVILKISFIYNEQNGVEVHTDFYSSAEDKEKWLSALKNGEEFKKEWKQIQIYYDSKREVQPFGKLELLECKTNNSANRIYIRYNYVHGDGNEIENAILLNSKEVLSHSFPSPYIGFNKKFENEIREKAKLFILLNIE